MKKILLLGVLFLSACEKNIVHRGIKIDNDDYNFIKSSYKQMKITKSEVIKKIGYPSILLTNSHWLYIFQEVKKQAFLIPQVIHSEVISLTFSDDNVLNGISKRILNHPKNLILDTQTTQIKDQNLTFLQQMYYNISRMGQR